MTVEKSVTKSVRNVSYKSYNIQNAKPSLSHVNFFIYAFELFLFLQFLTASQNKKSKPTKI